MKFKIYVPDAFNSGCWTFDIKMKSWREVTDYVSVMERTLKQSVLVYDITNVKK